MPLSIRKPLRYELLITGFEGVDPRRIQDFLETNLERFGIQVHSWKTTNGYEDIRYAEECLVTFRNLTGQIQFRAAFIKRYKNGDFCRV